LTKYSNVTKGQKDFSKRFKKALHLPHEPTEQEKSDELKAHAEQEEREHRERIKAMIEAEKEEDNDEGRRRVRREILYGRKKPLTNGDGGRNGVATH
jgi:hypothetical protein